MTEAELIQSVRRIVKMELSPILMGTVLSTEGKLRATVTRMEDEAPIDNLRLIQPYGLASRPKSGMDALIIPIAGNATHLNIVGQFDEGQPEIDEGESILYGADGQVIFMKNGGEIHMGSKTSASPAVLGDILITFLDALIDQITAITTALNANAATFIAVTGAPLSPSPINPAITAALVTVAAQLALLKSQYVDVAATNVVSQQTFLQRTP